jgi:hypothetical protein
MQTPRRKQPQVDENMPHNDNSKINKRRKITKQRRISLLLQRRHHKLYNFNDAQVAATNCFSSIAASFFLSTVCRFTDEFFHVLHLSVWLGKHRHLEGA